MAHFTALQDRPHSILATIRGLAEGWRESLERRRAFDKTYGELSSLSDRELADIGISRTQVFEIARDAAWRV